MSSATDHYDFFVSYARKDNADGWITNFVDELLAEHRKFTAGRELKRFFDGNDISAGADWQHTLNHGIAHSRLFVAFISPNYFASEWCRKEWRAWIDAEIAKHILTAGMRPVYIVEVPGLTDDKLSDHDFARQIADFLKISETDRVKLLAETPPVVKHLRRRQMTHNQPSHDVHSFYTEGIDALRRDDLRQVLNKLAQDLDHHAELLAKADASITTIPPYNRNFSGRLDELLQLREWLDKDDRTGVIHGVHGLGGIGKTELALTYAHGYASAYPGGRFLIQCEGKSSLREAILTQHDFTSLFTDRITDEQRKNPAEYFAAIQRHLGNRLESLGHVLLLLDNVTDTTLLTREQTDALTKLGPKLHLLATTRLPAPPTHKDNWISLDRLPDEDALELLEKHRPFSGDEDREAAWQIVKRLDGFTLAVELTAAFLAANQSTSYARMSEYLDLDDLEEMAEDSGVELIRHNHERRLSAVLGPMLDGLKPAERRFMEYAALLPPDQVPLPWLKELVTQDFPELAQKGRLKNPWNEVWDKLEKLSLISRTKEETNETRIFRMHRLVQELIKHQILQQHIFNGMCASISALISDRLQALEAIDKWVEAKWELKPLTATVTLFMTNIERVEKAFVLAKLGYYWERLAEYREAEPLLHESLSIIEKFYGPEHPYVAKALNELAVLFCNTGRLAEAKDLYRRAVKIFEQDSGNLHDSFTATLINLAALLHRTNCLAEAEVLCRRALTIAEGNLEPDHPTVAKCLNNLARVLDDTNSLAEAESLLRRALKINEQRFGGTHPKVAENLDNLARLLHKTNKLSEAESLFRHALAIDEEYFGRDHPDIARRLNHLSMLLIDNNCLTEAEPLLRRALTINEQRLGDAHPFVAANLNNLARVLHKTNRLSEAEPLFRRALTISEKMGSNHPEVAKSLNNLAMLLCDTNDLAEAETLQRRALTIDEQGFGSEHPEVAISLNNLAFLLFTTNRLSEAKPLYRRALAIFERQFGPNSPKLAGYLHDLATVLAHANHLVEAEPLYHRALTIYERSLGLEHPTSKYCRGELVGLQYRLGKGNKAQAPINRITRSDGIGSGRRPPPAHSDKVGRNDVCPCGSGKKFKKCCGA